MENLLSTVVFILPGFMMYFWVQMMGVNPVVKHTVPEFGAIAALAWFPVVTTSLAIMNIYQGAVSTIEELYEASGNLRFLLEFMGISVFTSYILSGFYVKIGYPVQQWAVNLIRKSTGKAVLDKSPSVWEEIFMVNKPGVIGVAKLGAEKPDFCGSILNVSRPFESKRGFGLVYIDYVSMLIRKYEIPIIKIYSDIDVGVNVFIYDYDAYKLADEKERKEPAYIQTPSRSKSSTS